MSLVVISAPSALDWRGGRVEFFRRTWTGTEIPARFFWRACLQTYRSLSVLSVTLRFLTARLSTISRGSEVEMNDNSWLDELSGLLKIPRYDQNIFGNKSGALVGVRMDTCSL